jgi:hypothetical protein
VPRIILKRKRLEKTAYILYTSPNIVRVVKKNGMGGAYGTHGRDEMHTKF